MKPLLVTFEGPEGSGKTTHAAGLVERMRGEGCEVVATREPGGTAIGEAIRDILLHNAAGEAVAPAAEALLFAASRAQLVSGVILPALERGAWVVCERFADSTTAYQGYGREFDVETMLAVNAFAIAGAEPDVTVLLDINVGRGFERLAERNRKSGRGLDRIESEDRAFHERVRDGYLALARRYPERFRVIDADREPDVVSEDVWRTVQACAGAGAGGAG